MSSSGGSGGRYVPPHSRRSGGGGGGGRQRLTGAAGPRSGPGPSPRPIVPQSGGSRWSNVDPWLRGPPLPSGPGDLFRSRPGGHGGYGGRSARAPAPPTRVAFFGDSFVRLFGLVDRPEVYVRGFKGSSAKGLGREGNENRDAIRRWVASNEGKLERLVFAFGSVDVHLSYYYVKYVKEGEIDLDTIAIGYCDFVADLSAPPGVVKTVLGVYPSPLADASVGPSLASYGSLSDEQAALVSASDDAKLLVRQERVRSFNRALEARCAERGVRYEDVETEIMDTETMEIKDAYRDVSDHNIHIVWVRAHLGSVLHCVQPVLQ